MLLLTRLGRRLRALLRRPALEHDLDDEVRFHLEMEIEKNQRSGMTPDEARRLALVTFGGVDRYKEEARDVRGVRLAEKIGQDVGYGFRMVRKAPGFAAVVILTLALGIGANTAIFSVVNAVLLRPLPYAEPDRLALVYSQNPDRSFPRFSVSYADWLDWKKENRVFTGIAVTRSGTMTIEGNQEPERLAAAFVSDNFFSVLGVRPLLGQLFAPGSAERGDAGVVLSHNFWMRRFGADTAIIGRTIPLNGQAQLVVAVLPQSYRSFGAEPDVYALLQPSSIPGVQSHAQHMLVAIARLRPNVSVEQARQEMEGIADRIGTLHPDVKGWSTNVFLLAEELTRTVRRPLLVLLVASAFVLLIACINIANLQLTRGATRGRELAVRRALGASRARLVGQLMVESAVLATLGGALGIAVAGVAMKLLLQLVPNGTVSRLDEIRLDTPVLLFALVTALATGVLFGLLPALRSSDPELSRTLREGGRRSGGAHAPRIRRALVVTEISLALVLLVCAGLVLQSFGRITAIDPGFRPESVVTMQLSLGTARYPDSLQFGFYRDALTRLSARPGIQSASAANTPPLTGGGIVTPVRIVGMPPAANNEKTMSAVTAITPAYFQTLGMRLMRGRDVAWTDPRPTIVVSEAAARRFWPNVDPLGRRVAFGQGDTLGFEVVGVVSDARLRTLTTDPDPMMYMLLSGAASVVRRTTLLVRGTGDVAAITGTTKNVLRELDPALPLFNIQPMTQIVAQSVAQPKLNSTLLAVFAALALILATVGIYGVVSYSVAQRTHEMGLRMALGAQQGNVLRLVVREGALLAGIGVLIGLLASRWATSVIATWLYGITPSDPATFVAVGLLLVTIALLASYLPARRATRVDPVIAMRAE